MAEEDDKLSPEEQRRIADAIQEKTKNAPCSRCGFERFLVVDAYTPIVLSPKKGELRINPGRTIPCAVVICRNCGMIYHHALGPLGLLPEGHG